MAVRKKITKLGIFSVITILICARWLPLFEITQCIDFLLNVIKVI